MNNPRIKIIYEDQWLLVADKPAGMPVIPTPKKERTLSEIVNDYLDGLGIEINAYPCHRLDRDTTGLVVFAKGKAAQQKMMDAFRAREVHKRYIAFAHGMMKSASGEISAPIYIRKKNRKEDALTRYRVLKKTREFTVAEVEPVTGRTNQIRLHFKQIGHPLVGESVFVFRKDFSLRFRRTALHAAGLEFRHPVTGEAVCLESGLPQDMKRFLENYPEKK